MKTHDAIQRRGGLARWFTLGWALAVTLALGACTGLVGPPQVSYSEAELNQMLARRFPLEKRVVGVLDVSLSNPRLVLKADGPGRMTTAFDIEAQDRLAGHSWRGYLKLEHGLKVDHGDNSLRLAEPRVRAMMLGQAGGGDLFGSDAQAERLGKLAIEKLLDGVVVHRLKPEQVDRLAQAGYELGEVQVSDSGVLIRAVPRH